MIGKDPREILIKMRVWLNCCSIKWVNHRVVRSGIVITPINDHRWETFRATFYGSFSTIGPYNSSIAETNNHRGKGKAYIGQHKNRLIGIVWKEQQAKGSYGSTGCKSAPPNFDQIRIKFIYLLRCYAIGFKVGFGGLFRVFKAVVSKERPIPVQTRKNIRDKADEGVGGDKQHTNTHQQRPDNPSISVKSYFFPGEIPQIGWGSCIYLMRHWKNPFIIKFTTMKLKIVDIIQDIIQKIRTCDLFAKGEGG